VGDAQAAGATAGEHADSDEPSELRGRINPLKGKTHERHLSENGQDGEERWKSLGGWENL
jgi:hypothetical protein